MVKIALVHDLAEALTGDFTPSDNIKKEDKRVLEEKAMREICEKLPNKDIAEEMIERWWDYELQRNEEAKMVKEFDKLEMVVQAYEYEREQEIDLSDFFRTTEGVFKHQITVEADREVRERRERERKERESNSGTI